MCDCACRCLQPSEGNTDDSAKWFRPLGCDTDDSARWLQPSGGDADDSSMLHRFCLFSNGSALQELFFVFLLGEKCETHNLLRVFQKSAKNMIF